MPASVEELGDPGCLGRLNTTTHYLEADVIISIAVNKLTQSLI